MPRIGTDLLVLIRLNPSCPRLSIANSAVLKNSTYVSRGKFVAVLQTPDQQIMPAAGKEDVDQVLSRVLSSKYFANAPKKQKFLRLICDFYLNGRAGELNEYLIGREVFDRDEGYNPASDPIVRVGAHDVRKKLDLYYKGDGAV
jgi:hypothetical protein